MMLPLDGKVHLYANSEITDDDDAGSHDGAVQGEGEHTIFCLDISASMNHDEKGTYVAPKSKDHPASSMKQARELIPPLALRAIKAGHEVTVVLWNYQIFNTIRFEPNQVPLHN